jgi:hypothetical protein
MIRSEVEKKKYVLPGVDQPRVVDSSPAIVLDALNIRRLLVELAHTIEGEAFKGLSVSAAVR